MSNEMKMSDVFSGDVVSDADTLIANGYGELADFSGYKKECRYVAHAINNHDRLTEENKRLRDLLRKINEGNCAYVENGEMYDDIENLLSELGGE